MTTPAFMLTITEGTTTEPAHAGITNRLGLCREPGIARAAISALLSCQNSVGASVSVPVG
jgi:hypothetical protein